MLTNLIENRGKEFTNLLKIGDYLARSLRENVELFFVDGSKVTYITESGSVITGKHSPASPLKLTNIEVEDSSILEDQKRFEELSNYKVSNILADLLENDYSKADNSFDDLLNVFTTKLSYDRVKKRLEEKVDRFGLQNRILDTGEFKRVEEIKDKIVEFLKENQKISKIPEIRNGIRLSMIIANSFNLPKITVEQLKESRQFKCLPAHDNNIYEHLCRQELVAKEILEGKKNFSGIWATHEGVGKLASMVYESDKNIRYQVAELVVSVPYFALATKKQINEILRSSSIHEDIKVTNKDFNAFVSKIYEMKKPVKSYIIQLLNDKYGLNVNNLTDIPTFSNLLKTENVIISSLARLAPKNSIIKKSLNELANTLSIKNGAESIDLAYFLNDLFEEAGLTKSITETSLMSYLDFNRVADDLGKIGQVLKLIQPLVGGGQPGQMGQPMGGEAPAQPEDPTQALEDPMDSSAEAGLDMDPEGSEDDEEGLDPQAIADEINGEDEDAAMNADSEGEDPLDLDGMPDEGMEDGEMKEDPGFEGEEDPEFEEEGEQDVSQEDLMDLMGSIEDVLSDLKVQLDMGDEGDEEGFEGEEDLEDEEGFEEEEGFEDEESEEEFDDEEEEEVPFKKK